MAIKINQQETPYTWICTTPFHFSIHDISNPIATQTQIPVLKQLSLQI